MCLGVPGEILSISGEALEKKAVVSFSGSKREVSLAFLPESAVGDFVVVHVGVAISKINKQEAEKSLATFQAYQESGIKP